MTPARVLRRRFLIPEMMQSSVMDCGPAALQAVLRGFGIHASYDALRERCETDVDGTSIDALARLGSELGLRSHEVLIAKDNFLLPSARCLPAIVVTRSAGGSLHFIVVWRRVGRFVQILDPGSGRRWLRQEALLELLPEIPLPVSMRRWRRWAGSSDSIGPLRTRLHDLGVRSGRARALLEEAAADPEFGGFARLDAALRMLQALVNSAALRRGAPATRLLQGLLRAAAPESRGAALAIPRHFWWVAPDPSDSVRLIARGIVVVHFSGRAPPGDTALSLPAAGSARPEATATGARATPSVQHFPSWSGGALTRAGERELERTDLQPSRILWALVRSDNGWTVCWIFVALVAGAALAPAEALLLRGLLDIHGQLVDYQQSVGMFAVLLLVAFSLWLDIWASKALQRIGRQLEMRLRVAFLEKLPLLEDRYLRSRSASDMAGRVHALHLLREVPALWARQLRGTLGVLGIAVALLWLYPAGSVPILILTLLALVVPYLGRRSISEASLRLRTHASALDHFYLDALLGATPVRVHGAEPALRAEHEQRLTEWARTAGALHRQSTTLQALQLVSSSGMVVALVLSYLDAGQTLAKLLLLAFWALRIPVSANDLTTAEMTLRTLRHVALRLLAPLAAPSAQGAHSPAASAAPAEPGAAAVRLELEAVSVQAGGHRLLTELQLDIAAGSHVAIVGRSGAGKSCLIGLLLGWLTPCTGRVKVDGRALDAVGLVALRNRTAWVDPAVQLWERSLFDNLVFGDDEAVQRSLPGALSSAGLLELLENLPEGLQANLGEAGLRVSGGQGQRVRLGRALMRRNSGLVLLDEPFRGLERERRQELLQRARAHWQDSTLLFVSHDLKDTRGFDRVLVIEDGRIIEDGTPDALLRQPQGRYASLYREALALESSLWSAPHWQKRSVLRGKVVSPGRGEAL